MSSFVLQSYPSSNSIPLTSSVFGNQFMRVQAAPLVCSDSSFSQLAKEASAISMSDLEAGDEFLVMEKKSFIEMMKKRAKTHGNATVRTVIDTYQTGQDLKDFLILMKEFGVRGKVIERVYRGKTYIILSGRPGLRRIFTGTRYLNNNTTMITHGVGRIGAGAKVMKGATITIMFVVAADCHGSRRYRQPI